MACARLRVRRPSELGRSRLLLALSDRRPGRAGRGEGQGTAGRRSRAAAGRAPLLVLAAGLVAAPFYSFDKLVHFILLGLLWGSAWLYMALAGRRPVSAGAVAGASRSSAVA